MLKLRDFSRSQRLWKW